MPILELVAPRFKDDPAVIAEAQAVLLPNFRVKLEEVGVRNGMGGFFETENGRDIRAENRKLVVLEYASVEMFQTLFTSDEFREFAIALSTKYCGSPPAPKLYDIAAEDNLSALFDAGTVLEHLEIAPRDALSTDTDGVLDALLAKLRGSLEKFGATKAVAGKSINLDNKEIALVAVYRDDEAFEAAKASAARQELLAEISHAADVTSLISHVERELPLAKHQLDNHVPESHNLHTNPAQSVVS
ncbi:hypothetical protein F4777DRAFT_39548 [Nemania sp. FL0916]|nr:hypothetical protein F4777DRAFT_39548 [Nemania sp. FL0916]